MISSDFDLGGQSVIKLKGMPDSMLRCIISEELGVPDFAKAFEEVRVKGQQLLSDAKVVMDFGARPLTEQLVCSILSDFVWPSGVHVAAWITYDAASQDLLKRVGLQTSEPAVSASRDGTAVCRTLMLHRSLRSGARVEHAGDVILVGHVNDGAEVLASGHVTVLGRLSGLVHAGCEGDESSAVLACSMETMQVRIGSRVGSLERGDQWWGKKVIARVDNGTVLINYWPQLKNESREETGSRSMAL